MKPSQLEANSAINDLITNLGDGWRIAARTVVCFGDNLPILSEVEIQDYDCDKNEGRMISAATGECGNVRVLQTAPEGKDKRPRARFARAGYYVVFKSSRETILFHRDKHTGVNLMSSGVARSEIYQIKYDVNGLEPLSFQVLSGRNLFLLWGYGAVLHHWSVLRGEDVGRKYLAGVELIIR